MNNLTTAQAALSRAKRWHQSARRGFEDERWDDVIYSYQMAVEQSLKAVLILFGMEYPKKHDISGVYLTLKMQDIPKWFLDKIKLHARILKMLVSKRGSSAYGYVDGITKDNFKDDAIQNKDLVKEIIKDCEELISEFSEKSKKTELIEK